MIKRAWISIKPAAIWVVIALAVLALGALLLTISGLYNVAASRGHFAFTRWILELGLHRSVATHSMLIKAPQLNDDALVRLGAGHFRGGCAPCHGSPTDDRNPIVSQMLPAPPSLATTTNDWTSEELFWIVKNGIKYTGMPAWVAQERDDEVWAIVAFLRKLPEMTSREYQQLTRSTLEHRAMTAAERVRLGSDAGTLSVCGRCHGTETLPTASRLVPVLAGRSAEYLAAALTDYAAGRRKSGIMQPVAAELDSNSINELATYYSGLLPRMIGSASPAVSDQILRGQEIATVGIPAKGVPPCLSCHAGSAASFPTLAGQHAPYMLAQIRLWQKGHRSLTAQGAIMAPIAARLTAQQAEDVVAFFESMGEVAAPEDSASSGSAQSLGAK